MLNQHFCEKHQTRYYKNEKVDPKGQLKVWYSHKLLNGTGFCVEQESDVEKTESVSSHKMLMCNAMNNAIALASSGKIQIDQIGSYYKKIYSELTTTVN